ncbi:MAG: hypothetical protein ACOY3P_03825 [Planctomycetota bacterium]
MLRGIAAVGLAFAGLASDASAATADAPSQDPFAVADQLDLVPTPQQIRLTGERCAVADWTIVIPQGSALAATGASEINDRIVSLGGKALPVVHALSQGNAIVLAPCSWVLAKNWSAALGVSAAAPGEQGYAIDLTERDNRKLLLAIGCDDLGTLYAAMTLRQLVQPGTSGPELVAAEVRDRPAFKRRCMGNIGGRFMGELNVAKNETAAELLLREQKSYIQWLARHKINMAGTRLSGTAGQLARRELVDFAHSYGIMLRTTYSTGINEQLRQTGNPWTDCVTRQEAKHCWTAFEEHKLRAQQIAESVHEGGYDVVVHHVTDSGSVPDPENWSKRCARCRAHYGDDQPRAVADQLKLYHDTIKARNPNVLFVAVLQPYHFQWAKEGYCENPMADAADMPHAGHTAGMDDPKFCRQAVARATAIHQAVAAALPDDVLVTFREAGRPEFDGACRLWPGHPIDIWVYYGRNMAWEGLWEPQCRLTKTWYRPGATDLLYNPSASHPGALSEICAAGVAEYCWNVEQPDAEANFHVSHRRYTVGGAESSEYQSKSLLPRLCRRMWGRSGAALLPLFAENVSLNYMGHPEYVAASKGEDWEDPYMLWEKETEVLQRACQMLDAELAVIDAGKPSGVYGDLRREPGYTSFLLLHYYANTAALKGEIEGRVLRIQQLVRQGRIDEAKASAAEFQKRLTQILAQAETVKRRIADDSRVTRTPEFGARAGTGKKRPASDGLVDYDFAAQPARIRNLVQDLAADASLGAVPEHLRAALGARVIEAGRLQFQNPFAADGRRGEGGWVAVPLTEFFTTGDGSRLARFPTRAWMGWQDDAIYLLAELNDTSRPGGESRPHDAISPDDDSLELLVEPGEGAEVCRFAINAAGSALDAKGNAPANQWNPHWQYGAARQRNGWAAEFRIPFAALGKVPKAGDAWRMNLVRYRGPRARDPEREASSVAGKGPAASPADFAELKFVERASRSSQADFALLDVRRQDQTVTYGFATQLSFRPELRTQRQSHDATIAIEVRAGEKKLGERRIRLPLLSGYWKPGKPIDFDLGEVVEGDVRVVVTATAEDKSLEVSQEFLVGPKGEVKGVE